MTKFRDDSIFDIVFYDASHNLNDNQKTFLALPQPKTILIHDTGTWAEEYMTDMHRNFKGGIMNEKGLVHQPAEVEFANWLEGLGYSRIDFHSENTLRHGITVLQKK